MRRRNVIFWSDVTRSLRERGSCPTFGCSEIIMAILAHSLGTLAIFGDLDLHAAAVLAEEQAAPTAVMSPMKCIEETVAAQTHATLSILHPDRSLELGLGRHTRKGLGLAELLEPLLLRLGRRAVEVEALLVGNQPDQVLSCGRRVGLILQLAGSQLCETENTQKAEGRLAWQGIAKQQHVVEEHEITEVVAARPELGDKTLPKNEAMRLDEVLRQQTEGALHFKHRLSALGERNRLVDLGSDVLEGLHDFGQIRLVWMRIVGHASELLEKHHIARDALDGQNQERTDGQPTSIRQCFELSDERAETGRGQQRNGVRQSLKLRCGGGVAISVLTVHLQEGHEALKAGSNLLVGRPVLADDLRHTLKQHLVYRVDELQVVQTEHAEVLLGHDLQRLTGFLWIERLDEVIEKVFELLHVHHFGDQQLASQQITVRHVLRIVEGEVDVRGLLELLAGLLNDDRGGLVRRWAGRGRG